MIILVYTMKEMEIQNFVISNENNCSTSLLQICFIFFNKVLLVFFIFED